MRNLLFPLIISSVLAANTSAAQKSPKIDSLLVQLPMPKADAMDAVIEAFSRTGLEVTDNSGSMVESDVGGKTNLIGVKYTRAVRAVLFGHGETTTVLIRGEEAREGKDGFTKRLRIDNKAGGNGKKVWEQMAAVAHALEDASGKSAQLTATPPQGASTPAPEVARASTPPVSADIPPGMAIVGDARTKLYYPVECASLRDVPTEARYFYATEEDAQKDGYRKNNGC